MNKKNSKNDKYEIIDINAEMILSYDDVNKNIYIKIEGKTEIDKLYLKMNEQGSGAHGVNIHPFFSRLSAINKQLSFLKFNFEKLFDLKFYDK
jgi:hypothetical protein